MYQVTDFTKNAYRVKEVADLLGTTPQTIRNYDKQGLIKTARNDGNQRIIMREDLIEFLDKKGLVFNNTDDTKRDVIYARVSSHDQKRGGTLDRLTRFGFNYLETMFLVHNVNIIIVKDKNEEKSVQEELAEDMLSLLASFSVKLYGMHSRKNVKKKVS